MDDVRSCKSGKVARFHLGAQLTNKKKGYKNEQHCFEVL